MKFEQKDQIKDVISMSLSQNARKLLRKYDFSEIASKADNFFNNFKNIINSASQPNDEGSIDVVAIAEELRKSIGAPVAPIGRTIDGDTIENDDRKPIKEEDLKSILAQYLVEYVSGPDPSSPDDATFFVTKVLSGAYGQTLSTFLFNKVAPRLTSDGVQDKLDRKRKGSRVVSAILELISNPLTKRHKDIVKKYEENVQTRTQFIYKFKDLMENNSKLPPGQASNNTGRLSNGQPPTGQYLVNIYNKILELFPTFPEIPNKLLTSKESMFQPYGFMEEFADQVKDNPDLIPDEEELELNILDYYEAYLNDTEKNLLTPNQMMDLQLIRDIPKKDVGTDDIKIADILRLSDEDAKTFLKKLDKDKFYAYVGGIEEYKNGELTEEGKVYNRLLSLMSKRQKQDTEEEKDFYSLNDAPIDPKEGEQYVLDTLKKLIENDMISLSDEESSNKGNLEEVLKPIIEVMLKEQYNY